MLIQCLGMIGAADGTKRLAPSERHILAVLVAAGPGGLSADRLAFELWGDDLPGQWEASVRKRISRLRRAVGIETVSTGIRSYALTCSVDEVDVWKLLAVDDLDVAAVTEALLERLIMGEPFAEIEPSPLLVGTLEPIELARVRLIEKLRDHRPPAWTPRLLLAARTLSSRSHHRDDILTAALDLHVASGATARAEQMAAEARVYLRQDMGRELSAAAEAVLARAAANPDEAHAPDGDETAPGRVVGMYEPANDPSMIHRIGLRDALDEALRGPGVVVHGDSGAGKSALIRSLIQDLAAAGRHVLWLSGRRRSSVAYEPFLAGAPMLEDELAPLLADGGGPLERARCWTDARRRLSVEFTGQPLVLVVDDAHWLDSHSRRFVAFLASTPAQTGPTLVVIGREDPDDNTWHQFADELWRAGLNEVEVAEFGHDELVELIGLHHPTSSSKQRHDFASMLTERRAALPAVAHELVRSADRATLTVATRAVGQTSGIWADRVGPGPRSIAAVAAVLGMRFRLPALEALSGVDLDTIVDAVDELLDARILAAEQRPDEFSFRHVLIHGDFEAVLGRGERRRLHLAAASIADDLHTQALHLIEAGALVGIDRVLEAVLRSAREFHAHGSYREAAQMFGRAQQLGEGELDVADLARYASAVASSGGDGWDLRATAFALAASSGDTDRCLDIALAGTLETEDAMGQQRRVEMLEQIDVAALTAPRRAVHAAGLARELGLLGRHEEALAVATAAVAAASTPDDRFTAWLGAWASCRSLPPGDWPPLPPDRALVTDASLGSRLAQVECARAIVLGDDATARQHLVSFRDHPFTSQDPLRTWHAALVESMFSFVDGRWDDHRRQIDAAGTTGAERAVIAAFPTRIAQEFVLQWIAGLHGALLAYFRSAPPDVQSSLLARCAMAITMAEHDEHRDEATTRIATLASEVRAHRSPLSPASAVLLASAPAPCLSAGVRTELRTVLSPFAGTAIVAGASISHLGPATWSLALLAEDRDERIACLRAACTEADSWNLRLWSIVCRRDLAEATGDIEPLAEATTLAAGTSLEMLV